MLTVLPEAGIKKNNQERVRGMGGIFHGDQELRDQPPEVRQPVGCKPASMPSAGNCGAQH
jgi:hypothetical protein